MYRAISSANFTAAMAVPAIGVARGFLSAYEERLRAKSRTIDDGSMINMARYANASAKVDSVHAVTLQNAQRFAHVPATDVTREVRAKRRQLIEATPWGQNPCHLLRLQFNSRQGDHDDVTALPSALVREWTATCQAPLGQVQPVSGCASADLGVMAHAAPRTAALLIVALGLAACRPSPPPQPPTAIPTPLPTASPAPTAVPLGTGPLRTDGAKLVDAAGREVRLTGINWSGLESHKYSPVGLASRGMDEMLDQIVVAGFNTIRLPYSSQLFDPASKPGDIDYKKNPDLQGLTGPQVMDRMIDGAGRRGLKVILDRHSLTADGQSDLWYSDQVPEQRWISDWMMLADRYRGNPAVIGADLHNEPHGAATWGDSNPHTDWRLAAERAGNAILAVNPDWLIVVEGIESVDGAAYWWGGNLSGASDAPVRLALPNHLVYSAHDYGPAVSWQRWFEPPEFPANLPGLWRTNWAYLQEQAVAPVLIGEFGGRSVGQDTEGVWQRTLISFLRDEGFSYTYWVWNFNGWTGGLLLDDQTTLNTSKLSLLSPSQWPLIGEPSTPYPSPAATHTPTPRARQYAF
jgi:endoglucanase